MRVTFTVPGTPVGKGRPRASVQCGHPHLYTPEKTVEFERHVSACYKTQCGYVFPENVPVFASFVAYFTIPKSASKKKKAEMDGSYCLKKPDTDNIMKSVLDALNEIAYPDDSAVMLRPADKRWTTGAPRLEVTLTDEVD